jgi:hypothetical protein
MTDRDEFLAWVKTALYEAEVALHNGHADPRRAVWSSNEPVSVLGALRNAIGQHEVDELFTSASTSSAVLTAEHLPDQAAGKRQADNYTPCLMKSASPHLCRPESQHAIAG